MRITPLQRIIVEEDNDGTQTTRLPNNKEMMDKMNEIIRVINELDSFKSDINHKNFVKQMTKGW